MNEAGVHKLLRKRSRELDVAITSALKEAGREGYVHFLLGKARDTVAWATSPEEVVVKDPRPQKDCRESASVYPNGSTALVSKHSRRNNGEVACVRASACTMARDGRIGGRG